ncbi:MAG TPA: hypothetical protein PKD94_03100 [Ignavibacteria bacterium]|nr:hypothetical protein [Ignavibacteria bacterium]
MKKNLLFLIVCAVLTVSFNFSLAGGKPVLTGGPHDSLLFDGENSTGFFFDDGYKCYWKVVKIKGFAYGQKRILDIGKICGVPDTVEIIKADSLKEDDILADGTLIETGKDGQVAIAAFLKTHPNSLGRMFITTQPSTLIKVPTLGSMCDELVMERRMEEMGKVLIIKGTVTMDSPPTEKVKLGTKGKRSSVKHKKTRYSHEVLITADDTTDIVRVYEGTVEISHIREDFSDEEAKAKEMEQLTQDFQAGKITMEEMMKKVEEYTNNAKQVSENLKPFEVEAGNKCILGKTLYSIEPLGPGDEDDSGD